MIVKIAASAKIEANVKIADPDKIVEIVLIALIVLLLFGGKKIPELMKGLGKGVRSFKEGMNNIENDIENSGTEKSNNENK